MISRELYDHRHDIPGTPLWEAKDDFEDINAASEADPALLSKMASELRKSFGMGGWPSFAVDA